MNGPSSRAFSAAAVLVVAGGLSTLASAAPPSPGGPLPGGGTTPIGSTVLPKPDPSQLAAAKGPGAPSYTLTAYVKNETLPSVPWPANTDLVPPGTFKKTSVPTSALATAGGNQGAGQTAQGATSTTDPPAAWVGTKGSGMGVEAFSVTLGTPWPSCLALEYMAHVPGQGDTGWFQPSARIGTPGS